MKRFFPLSLIVLALSACADETITGFTDPGTTWRLEEVSGQPFDRQVTLTFPEKGRLAGQGPCNRYSGPLDAVYPWFKTGPLVTTRKACCS